MSHKLAFSYQGVSRTINSAKNGKTYVFTELWVQIPSAPYPQKIDVFGAFNKPAGNYVCPLDFVIKDSRLTCQLLLDQAQPVEHKG